MNLHKYDIVVINSSAGKDSLVSLWDIARQARQQNYPSSRIIVSHQDLERMEWLGTKELVKKQADFFGFRTIYSKRIDKHGKEETLLEYVLRRGMWPSSEQRWCTSDFKRGPGRRVLTHLCKDIKNANVLYVFGFRHEESPARAKKETLVFNKNASTQLLKNGTRKRTVWDYCPILTRCVKFVWKVIKLFKLPYHFAYDLGMPRLSCCFCIFSPFDALVIAGYHNYELLCEYVQVEEIIKHTFKIDLSLKQVKEAIDSGYKPKNIPDWVM
ncbi:phosphoadenosine phosphosulfate reductase domain-containing protein [Flavobacterium sp. HNIBRBA15423]|uniref:phosphoadenosine phosphosulfate reductase domain-containing protein n=1 Tax=Flavobacterium sp. HNIBRBA15423 TaxID=3458683 RepID=UPI0040443AAE